MKQLLIKNSIFTSAQQAQFLQASTDLAVRFIPPTASADVLKTAHAIIGNFPAEALRCCGQLEWLQLDSSGADLYAHTPYIPQTAVITTATGAYGLGIGEYMVAMLLAMMKKIPTYLQYQRQAVWQDAGPVTTLFGKRVLIIGAGNIGREFAGRIRPFGCHIVGIRRHADRLLPEFDEMYDLTQLQQELAKADITTLCLPGTEQTFHLMDKGMLCACKPGAYLLNVGRGSVIPMEALLDETVTCRFSGIWLDVCETEPLPDGHPLFRVPNLLLTPHITGGFHLDLTVEKIFEISMHNLNAWLRGGEYRSVLERSTGYCR